MKHYLVRILLVALLLTAGATTAHAQAIETPEPFDSVGRVMSITPRTAARLGLRPPAWRITGVYDSARLYALDSANFVIVVTRPSGVVERYAITRSDREYLRARTSTLPPGFEEQLGEGVARASQGVRRATRNAFVLNQSLLGLTVYAPSFAIAVTNNDAARAAAYLLVAGGTFFGAAEVARDIPLTDAQIHLSTHTGAHGALGAYGIAYALDADHDGRAAAPFLGGVAGTVAGLYFGRSLSDAEAAASGFAADVTALTALVGVYASAPETHSGHDVSRGDAALIVGAGLAGYPLGVLYPRRARYTVTAGDVHSLWTTGALGALGASAFLGHDPRKRPTALALGTGFLAGIAAGDLLLVRRYDHSRSEGNLLALGAAAGALMGAGVVVLVDADQADEGITRGVAAVGGAAGLALTERYLAPKAGTWSRTSSVTVDPLGVGLAAAGVRGTYPIVRVSF